MGNAWEGFSEFDSTAIEKSKGGKKIHQQHQLQAKGLRGTSLLDLCQRTRPKLNQLHRRKANIMINKHLKNPKAVNLIWKLSVGLFQDEI